MTYTVNLVSKSIAGSVTTTDITSYVLNGFSFVEKINEELDIGTMTLRGLTTSTPYTMFDSIEVLIDSDIVYSMRIGGDSVRLISKNPLKYEHTLSLVEHTKILELYTISGKTFTQPTDGSTLKSLYSVISDLRATTPLELSDLVGTTRVFLMPDSTLSTYLQSIPSPEFTFKDVTLREALNQVCGYVDAIPRLILDASKNLKLTLDFTNELKDLIASENVFIEKSVTQEISLHSTQLESDVLNIVNSSDVNESIEYYPSDGSYVTPRTEDYIFDFTKSYIPTPKKIYQVPQVTAYISAEVAVVLPPDPAFFPYGGGPSNPVLIEIPITDFIVEYEIYKTLDKLPTALEPAKSNTIFYNYKQKNIQIGETYGFWDTQISIDDCLEFSLYQKLIADGYITDLQTGAVSFVIDGSHSQNDYMFRVEYIPIPTSVRINIDRQDLSDVNRFSQLLSNQQDRIVNTENITNNLQGRLNRIGNSELQLDYRTTDINDIHDVGDYTSDYHIITTKELLFYKNYIYAKYDLSKNYNMISKFIGVNSEIRQWEIGQDNTLERKIMYSEYVEIDVVENIGTPTGDDNSYLITTDGKKAFIDTLYPSSTYEPVKGGIIDSSETTDDLICNIGSNGGGNSLIFDFQYDSNINAGSFREDDAGQEANNFASYVDEYGNMETFKIHLFDTLDTGDTTLAQFIASADDYPKTDKAYIDTTYFTNDIDYDFYTLKDTREKIGGTLTLKIIPSSINKVIIGRWLARRNRLVNENPPTSIKLYTSTTAQLGRIDNFDVPSGFTEQTSPTISINYTNQTITVTHANLTSSVVAWCLTDENDKILLGFNQDSTLLNVITFDFNNKRSGINYKY